MVGVGVELKDVSKSFDRNGLSQVVALSKLNLAIRPGQFLIVMGPNGSGKTTLLSVVQGRELQDEGEVLFSPPQADMKQYPVYLKQDPSSIAFPGLSLAEHFLIADLRGKGAVPIKRGLNRERLQRYTHFLDRYGFPDLVDKLPSPIQDLSGGMRQAAMILAGLMMMERTPNQSAGLLLLDEPTASLDLVNEQRILELLRLANNRGTTVIMVTHDSSVAAAIGDSLIILNRGTIAERVDQSRKSHLDSQAISLLLLGLRAPKSDPLTETDHPM